MSSKPTLIAQISDLHIKPPGALAYGRVDTAKALENCVAALDAFAPVPDFVVISGDLVDTPSVEEYDYLKRLLAPLRVAFAGVPGNHDSREWMRAAFPSAPYAHATGPLDQKIEVDGIDLLLLDRALPESLMACSRRRRCNGWTRRWRRQLIDRRCSSLHHPPLQGAIRHMDRQDLFNAEELAAESSGVTRVRS